MAGLSAAVRLAAPLSPAGAGGRPATGLRVGVLTKAELSQSATRWAQGGVAAVLGGDEDSTDLHLADTLAAGAGLCDTDAVRVLVDEGPARVNELIAMGAVFDRQPGGALALAREGGHSTARVVHAGGRRHRGRGRAGPGRRHPGHGRRRARGVVRPRPAGGGRTVPGGAWPSAPTGRLVEVRATHTVLATGGAGQLFAVTTNPAEATADGLAMALRAGVPVADVEFMQFHPTALHHPAMPRPLLSEALRGHGALLRDAGGERFVDELAPRDVVSRAMAERMRAQGVESLWLDATGLDSFDARFPTIAASLRAIGLDPSRDWLPIAPAAHYLSGGVVTDLSGATALPGLWAAGEVACTGVHGANRLASNSLLEGMVFGARLAESILAGDGRARPTGVMAAFLDGTAERRSTRRPGGAVRRVGRARRRRPVARDLARRDQDPGPAPAGDDRGGRRGPQRRLAGRGRAEPSRPSAPPSAPAPRRTGPTASWPTWSPRPPASCARPRSAARPGAPTPAATIPEASERWRRRIVHADGGVAVLAGPGRPATDRPSRAVRR